MGTEGNSDSLEFVKKTARTYATNRIHQRFGGNRRAKIGGQDLQKELEQAAVFGELSCLERITAVLVDDPQMDRSDLESEIHLGIIALYTFLRKEMGQTLPISLERYLEMRGYFGERVTSQVATVSETGAVPAE